MSFNFDFEKYVKDISGPMLDEFAVTMQETKQKLDELPADFNKDQLAINTAIMATVTSATAKILQMYHTDLMKYLDAKLPSGNE